MSTEERLVDVAFASASAFGVAGVIAAVTHPLPAGWLFFCAALAAIGTLAVALVIGMRASG